MADHWRVFEASLESTLEDIRRQVTQMAATRRFNEGEADEDPIIEVKVTVDLNAVLRAATSSGSVQQVLRTEGEEDYSPTEVTRKRKVKDSPQA